MKLTKSKLRSIIKEEIQRLNEKVHYIGPFVFSSKTKIDDLMQIHADAVSGYANWGKGMGHSKGEYKKAYQTVEKILKDRYPELTSNQRTLLRQRGV